MATDKRIHYIATANTAGAINSIAFGAMSLGFLLSGSPIAAGILGAIVYGSGAWYFKTLNSYIATGLTAVFDFFMRNLEAESRSDNGMLNVIVAFLLSCAMMTLLTIYAFQPLLLSAGAMGAALATSFGVSQSLAQAGLASLSAVGVWMGVFLPLAAGFVGLIYGLQLCFEGLGYAYGYVSKFASLVRGIFAEAYEDFDAKTLTSVPSQLGVKAMDLACMLRVDKLEHGILGTNAIANNSSNPPSGFLSL